MKLRCLLKWIPVFDLKRVGINCVSNKLSRFCHCCYICTNAGHTLYSHVFTVIERLCIRWRSLSEMDNQKMDHDGTTNISDHVMARNLQCHNCRWKIPLIFWKLLKFNELVMKNCSAYITRAAVQNISIILWSFYWSK